MSLFEGEIKANLIEVRFAGSGKVISVLKKAGDKVKKGELLASLDKKTLQAELDKQLGDFEKVRAEFEIFNLQKGEPKDEITKYLKSGKQAELNISVKEVELAKARLDQTDLFSPIEGIIINNSNLISGIYVSPSSNPIIILDTASYYFEFEIEQKDFLVFSEPKEIKFKLNDIEKEYTGMSSLVPRENGKLMVKVIPQDQLGLFFGLKAKAEI